MEKSRRIWSSLIGLVLLGTPTIALLPLPAIAQTAPTAIRQAYTLLGQGLVNQAIGIFERAVRQYPQSTEARLGLAISYRRAGRDADAFTAYQQVLQVDPSNRLALLSIGVLGGFRSEWQNRGIEALNVLLRQNPNDPEALAQRALLFGYQGRFGESIADYTIVLRNNPTPEVILGAAQIYSYSGDFAQSIALFDRYRATGGQITGGAAIAYANALRETGNPTQAVQILEAQLRQSRELDSTAIQLRAALASAYGASGLFDQATRTLAPLVGRQDSRLTLARALNEIADASGSPVYAQQAIDLYKQVISQTPNLTVGIAREIADVLSGYPQEQAYALEIYRQLAQQNPGDRSLAIQQIVLSRQLGLVTDAQLQQQLQQQLQAPISDPSQLRSIAQAFTRLDSPTPALLPLYQNLLASGANEPFLNFRIAQILIEQNNFAGARNALAAYAATPQGTQDQFANMLLLAEIDRREGNLTASAQRYQMILSSNPTDSGVISAALQGLAGILQVQGRLPEAIALYDQIIARNPQDVAKQLGRTSLALQANLISPAQAEAVLNGWLSTRPLTETPPELLSLVAALPANPQLEGLYGALLAVDPNNLGLQLRQVQVLAARNPSQARAQLEQLIARDPSNLGTYFVQGQLAQQLGDLSQASEVYEAILQRSPNNTDALAALGGIQFQQRRYDAATNSYSQILALQPQNPTARSSLISLSAAQGRPIAALQQLEQLQLQQGTASPEIDRQRQQIEEGLLQQRGFQPPWERF